MNFSATSTKIIDFIRIQLMTNAGRRKMAIAVLAFTIVFISIIGKISSFSSQKEVLEDTGDAKTDTSSYEEALETRLEEIISSVDGVGKCKVMITLEKDDRKIFAKDSYNKENENKYEYVIVKNGDGDNDGLVESTVMPEIRGVAVVCDGGDSAVVRTEVVSLVSSVFSVSSARISVSKMK